jgi:hypothetical protein
VSSARARRSKRPSDHAAEAASIHPLQWAPRRPLWRLAASRVDQPGGILEEVLDHAANLGAKGGEVATERLDKEELQLHDLADCFPDGLGLLGAAIAEL